MADLEPLREKWEGERGGAEGRADGGIGEGEGEKEKEKKREEEKEEEKEGPPVTMTTLPFISGMSRKRHDDLCLP